MMSILLHGWLMRSFLILLFLLAIIGRVFTDENSHWAGAAFLIVLISFLIVVVAASRLPLFTHSNMAKILPNYQRKLKQSLIIVWGISLLPTLLLLPNITLWLGLLSILMLVAITFVAMIYRPIFQVLFWLIFFVPLGLDFFAPNMSGQSIILVCAWLLPLVLVLANVCLNKLMQYQGNTIHVNRLISMMNASMKQTLAVQENIPLHERTKLSQWWSNSHFDYYRKRLNINKDNSREDSKLSNRQLIAICCQGANSFGRAAYVFWICAISMLCLLGVYLDNSYHHYFTILIMAIPVMIIGTGTIAVFQIIQNKKNYLSRIATTPRFSQKNSFTRSLMVYVILNQAALYAFITLFVGATALVFHHITFNVFINLFLVLLLYGLLNLSIMFLAWAAKQDHSNKVVWLLILALISLVVFSILLKDNPSINLVLNTVFIFISSNVVVLFGYSLNRYSQIKLS